MKNPYIRVACVFMETDHSLSSYSLFYDEKDK